MKMKGQLQIITSHLVRKGSANSQAVHHAVSMCCPPLTPPPRSGGCAIPWAADVKDMLSSLRVQLDYLDAAFCIFCTCWCFKKNFFASTWRECTKRFCYSFRTECQSKGKTDGGLAWGRKAGGACRATAVSVYMRMSWVTLRTMGFRNRFKNAYLKTINITKKN